jgi:hypothetical protein
MCCTGTQGEGVRESDAQYERGSRREFLQNDMAKSWELREGVFEKLLWDVGCHMKDQNYICAYMHQIFMSYVPGLHVPLRPHHSWLTGFHAHRNRLRYLIGVGTRHHSRSLPRGSAAPVPLTGIFPWFFLYFGLFQTISRNEPTRNLFARYGPSESR